MGFLDSLRRQFTLATVSGVPVRADLRWIFVLVLLAGVIAGGIRPLAGDWASAAMLGAAATFVFFLSIFLHEYAHSVVARIEGLKTVEIVLHPFGGLTRFRHEPETPRAEFRIAVAGPGASFLLALVFTFAAVGAGAAELTALAVVLYTVAIGNFLIAVFNMFPGYPLDGGRVLRAYLWRSGRDLNEATILTGRSGQAIGVMTGIFGLYFALVRGELFTGFWAVTVGVFLFDSAKRIIDEVRGLERIAVDDVMRLPMAADPASSIQEFVDHTLIHAGQPIFPVAVEGRLEGMLLLKTLRSVPREEWRSRHIREVMAPVEEGHFITAGTAVADAREAALRNGLGSVAVLDAAGKLVGMYFTGR
ncbi:MAG TPA: site-2 protease family protein [Pyrinomonadaceae bacterium]|nr:site-2 protease family protein [Pyrinomonadaceae bacterium]